MEEQVVFCNIHLGTKLVCPRCIAAKGGTNTAKKYGSDQLSRWGAKGGRPKKKKSRKKKRPPKP
jgi:hypothetical protein